MVAFNESDVEEQLRLKATDLYDFCVKHKIPLLIHAEYEDASFTSVHTPGGDVLISNQLYALLMQLQLMGIDV